MRKIGLILAALIGGASLQAQTPATNASSGNVVGTANSTRTLSLEEAIQLALQNNLDIQISRYNPIVSQYAISEAYAVYEPSFRSTYTHRSRTTAGGFNADLNILLPSSTSESDAFSLGVGQSVAGYAPGGLQYSFGGVAGKTDAQNPFAVPPRSLDYTAGTSINLQQPLLRNFWIDPSRAVIQISKRNLHISEDQLREVMNDIILKVEQAYYNLIFARENVKVKATALELASQLLRENRKRVEVGALAPLDEKQSESEVASTRAALIDAERQLSEQQNLLKGLMTVSYADWTAVNVEPVENLVAVPVTLNLQESWKRALTSRPDLSRLKFELEKAGITLKLRKNQLWPELDLVGSYGISELNNLNYSRAISDLSLTRNPSYSYGVILDIPLGNRAQRARYNSAKASQSQSLLVYKQLEQAILVQVDDAVKLIRSSFERIEATRAARVFAEEALAAEQKKLENGKSTSFLVLQAQRDLTVRRSDEIRALADYNNALAALANREGSTLDRHSIAIK